MQWYLNELSLEGQYKSIEKFHEDLRTLLKQRATLIELQQRLFCSRNLSERNVTNHATFQEAVLRNKSLIQPVLSWLNKDGPFWSDEREQITDDYFELNGIDVTEMAIGEACRATLNDKAATLVSFPNGAFNIPSVQILHGLPEEPLGVISLDNQHDLDKLRETAFSAIPFPINWNQMLEVAKVKFPHLIFTSCCIDSLRSEPFVSYVVERTFELLRVLEEFAVAKLADGTFTEKNHELIDTHFSGAKAWFTDESDQNKDKFKDDMTFSCDDGTSIFCPWHGKIKTPQYRIHFTWPLTGTAPITIAYIGPKLTKR